MKRLSFILPCYNVENYVERCLSSIFSCGLSVDEYEVLCIYDSSTDGTVEKLHSISEEHNNLHIYESHVKIGPGACRDLGVRMSSGKYIWFVDSDDSIVSKAVIALINDAEDNNVDVLAFNFRDLNDDGSLLKQTIVFSNSIVYSGEKFVNQVFGDQLGCHLGYIWRFLYRKEYILSQNITFPKGNWEDALYMAKSMIEASRIKGSSIVGYEYWHHASSICRKFEKSYSADMLYEFAIISANNLLLYAQTIRNDNFRQILINVVCTRYYNRIPVMICRQNQAERNKFYDLVDKEYSSSIRPYIKYMSFITKCFVCPIISRHIATLAGVIYKIKH